MPKKKHGSHTQIGFICHGTNSLFTIIAFTIYYYLLLFIIIYIIYYYLLFIIIFLFAIYYNIADYLNGGKCSA